MDLNLTILAGRLASDPEVRVFDDGNRLMRMLVTTRQETPKRRIDVVPVTVWSTTGFAEDAEFDAAAVLTQGDRVWVAGSVQRRFWTGGDGRSSRIEVVAHSVQSTDAPLPEFEMPTTG